MKSQLAVILSRLRGRLNVKFKPLVLSHTCEFKKNYVLHSVTMGSLLDLENKWKQNLYESVTRKYISAKCLVQGLNIVASWKKPFKWSLSSFACVWVRNVRKERDKIRRKWKELKAKQESWIANPIQKRTCNLNSLFEICSIFPSWEESYTLAPSSFLYE